MIKDEVKKIIEKTVKKAGFELLEFSVEKPKDVSHGDYSSNIALALSKKLGKNPMEVAQKITGGIKNDLFEKIEVALPGFINFYLKPEIFNENIRQILKQKESF